MDITIGKAPAGEQDLELYDGITGTYTRATSSGGTITLNRVGYEVDALMVYGGGVNYTDATIQSALTAIGVTTKAILVLRPGAWVISNNLSITANITLKIPLGATVSIAVGKTLTFADPRQVVIDTYYVDPFLGAGSVVITAGSLTYTPATALTASVLKALLFVSSTTVVLDNAINDFRLTLTTGVPVTTADVTGATTIYCTPYRGNRIALYSGSAWVIDTSAEFSLALGTLTASLPYDVFCYDNAGVPTLEFLAWASATTRATALAYQDGILVKSGAATRRYLGTFYTSSTTQTADAVATRYLENYYNTVDRTLAGVFSTDRSTTSGTYAEINSEIQIKWVQGNIENPVRFNAIGSFSSGTSSQGATAVGIDSTTVATGGLETTTTATTAWSGFSIVNNVTPATGYHYATLLGASGGTTTWASATSLMKTKTWLSAMKKG